MNEDKKKVVLDEEEMDTEEVDNDAQENDKGIEGEVMAAIQPCLDRIKAGEYKSKDEAIDALIADLEAAREGGEALGGLGEEGPMDLPEDEEVA